MLVRAFVVIVVDSLPTAATSISSCVSKNTAQHEPTHSEPPPTDDHHNHCRSSSSLCLLLEVSTQQDRPPTDIRQTYAGCESREEGDTTDIGKVGEPAIHQGTAEFWSNVGKRELPHILFFPEVP